LKNATQKEQHLTPENVCKDDFKDKYLLSNGNKRIIKYLVIENTICHKWP